MMLFRFISFALLIQVSLVLAAPVKRKASSLESKPMTESIRHRMYRKTNKDANGRELSRLEWEQLLKNNPTLEDQYQQKLKQDGAKIMRRYYIRNRIMKNPKLKSKYLEIAEKEGFKTEDLTLGGQDRSDQACAMRRLITSALTRLREDIKRVGIKDQKSTKYYPGATKKKTSESIQRTQENTAEGETLKELRRFHVALRANPYDPRLISMRDHLHTLMKLSLSAFHPIKLPYLSSKGKEASLSTSRGSSSGAMEDQVDSPYTLNGEQTNRIPLSDEEIRAQTAEERRRYIQRLFE